MNSCLHPRCSENEPLHIRLSVFLKSASICSVLFIVTFYSANEYAISLVSRWKMYSQIELKIPYMESWFSIYGSVFILVCFVPFILQRSSDIRRWGHECNAAILLAAICFFALPAELGYPILPRTDTPSVVAWIKGIAGQYNLFPSLHVALSTITVKNLKLYCKMPQSLCLDLWWVMVVASTLLTHQHHIVDVLGGMILAWGTMHCMRRQ